MTASSILYDTPSTSGRLILVKHDKPSLSDKDNNVLVKFLASPINKVDLMVMSGRYPVKPSQSVNGHPILGFDGCGRVVESLSKVLKPGDLVVPSGLGLGTWRTHAVLPEQALIKLPRDTPPVGAALIRSGAAIAWLLLHQITTLKPSDYVIMTAGTSCVAQFLVQLARMRGVNVILVVRDNMEFEKTKNTLMDLGAEMVVTESEVVQLPELPGPITLALDCVFGHVGEALLELASPGAKFVLVGVLSGVEAMIHLTARHLFTKQLSLFTFRGSSVLSKMGDDGVKKLFNELAQMFVEGLLIVPNVNMQEWTDDEEVMRSVVQMSERDTPGTKKSVWIFEASEAL